MLLASALAFFHFATPDLGAFRIEPWKHLAPDPSETLFRSAADGNLARMSITRNATGKIRNADTTRFWNDPRGRCITERFWSFGDTTTLEISSMWGYLPDRYPDSLRLASIQAGRVIDRISLRREGTAQEPTWSTSHTDPDPESSIPDTVKWTRDALGRLVGMRAVFGRIVEVETIEWGADGAPRNWESVLAYDQDTLRELHRTTWQGTRLAIDSITSNRHNPLEPPTSRSIRCIWDDTLLTACNGTGDSISVIRNAQQRPIALHTWNPDQRTSKLWNPHGQPLSARYFTHNSLDIDSMIYADQPGPVLNLWSTCDASSLTDTCFVDETTTYEYNLLPGTSVRSSHPPPQGWRSMAQGLQATVSTTLSVRNPSGVLVALRILAPGEILTWSVLPRGVLLVSDETGHSARILAP